eukprot:TRINITY_DN17317_c0_g1_i1.p1 TRINITY_DN17317_c0_g1~~TRINITY_DN17317_c0_g1_i1.p1  ORF type:complete len:401 (+),score=85.64 TRINITY_DN17317_c0_g1_i1:52-1254(+)
MLTYIVAGVAIWATSVHFYAKKLGLKQVWSATMHPSLGITFEMLLRLLWENGFRVHPIYWHRLVILIIKSIYNSILAFFERLSYDAIIRKTKIVKEPVFILGHWRSGTTHLHNLMSQDTELFCYPTTFQCINPWVFLKFEKALSRQARFFLPATRPMDNVPFGPDTPQEDEFATCTMCGVSPQTGDVFPANYQKYYKALTFKGCTLAEAATWRQAFLLFLKKLTVRYGADKHLLLKSPHHTARVKILLQMFPNAKFIHIRRNPYVVYQSTKHLMDTLYTLSYLQLPPLEKQDDIAIDRYREMYDAYFDDIKALRPDQIVEVKYETLVQQPIEEMERVYSQLKLPGWDQAKAKFEEYSKSQSSFARNKHPNIANPILRRINSAWKRVFDAWDYDVIQPTDA